MPTRKLFTTPEPRYFGESDEQELAKFLTQLERVTQVPYVSRADELCLAEDGTLPKGYRYTEAAFKQVCSLACKGLYLSVMDLSGIHRRGAALRDDYSFPGAINLFNSVIRRRFAGRFNGKARIVKNTDPAVRLVEGVLGPSYHY